MTVSLPNLQILIDGSKIYNSKRNTYTVNDLQKSIFLFLRLFCVTFVYLYLFRFKYSYVKYSLSFYEKIKSVE